MRPALYREYCSIERSDVPLTRQVQTDDMTDMANECFDLPFDGTCKFYPYVVPKLPEYRIMAVVGKSGSGKSTLLKSLKEKESTLNYSDDQYLAESYTQKYPEDEAAAKAFIGEFKEVGLNPTQCWCKKFPQLSEGEKFRALVALQLQSGVIFDEFTSMVDREVAKKVCTGVKRLVEKEDLHNVVVCSCHKDFIPWLQPDVIVDLDDSKVYVKGIDSDTPEENVKSYTEEVIGQIVV